MNKDFYHSLMSVWIEAKRRAAGFRLPNPPSPHLLPLTTHFLPPSTMKMAGIVPKTIGQSEAPEKINSTVLWFEPTLDRRMKYKMIT